MNKTNSKDLVVELTNFSHPHSASNTHQELHKTEGGEYIKSIVYGGLDGIVSVFVSVAAVEGANSAIKLVILLGLAKLIAGAISMGVGDWMSASADVDYAKNERRREQWEMENYIEGEIDEMVELYVQKGLKEPTARRLMEIVSSSPKLFLDMMMVDELGILPEEENQIPWKHGVANFTSFVIFGAVPLLSYVVFLIIGKTHSSIETFGVSIASTGFTLILMGAVKGKLTGTNILGSSATTLVLGAIGATLGWLVSFLLYKWTGASVN